MEFCWILRISWKFSILTLKGIFPEVFSPISNDFFGQKNRTTHLPELLEGIYIDSRISWSNGNENDWWTKKQKQLSRTNKHPHTHVEEIG